jgi:hypothetical protein
MKRLLAATVLVGSIAVGVQSPSTAVGVQHHQHFHPLYYTTQLHHHKVWVDISGNAWKSKHDAKKESRRLLKWLESIGY